LHVDFTPLTFLSVSSSWQHSGEPNAVLPCQFNLAS
jgi:hypothetical protein